MNSAQFTALGLTLLSSHLVFATPPFLNTPPVDSLCALVHSQHWTARKPNTDWKLSYAPLTFPLPSDVRARCLTHPNQPPAHCLVLQSAGYTFWTFQNSKGTVLIAYDTLGNIGGRWEMPGMWVADMKINPLIDTVDFIGEDGQTSSLTWHELSLDPAPNLPPAPPPEVPKTPQTITLETPTALTVGATLSLNATGGNSANRVTLESTTPQICMVAENKLTALRAGVCTIVAKQAGDEHFTAAVPVEKNISITAPVILAPSQLCFGVTGTLSHNSATTRAGFCNDYQFDNNKVPCLFVTNGSEIKADSCEINALSPRPYPMKSLTTTGRAEISTTYSSVTPRCDSSVQFTETTVKLPNTLAFTCIRYERDAAAQSFYYGVALLSNSQVLSYKFETAPDRCVGQCPASP